MTDPLRFVDNDDNPGNDLTACCHDYWGLILGDVVFVWLSYGCVVPAPSLPLRSALRCSGYTGGEPRHTIIRALLVFCGPVHILNEMCPELNN